MNLIKLKLRKKLRIKAMARDKLFRIKDRRLELFRIKDRRLELFKMKERRLVVGDRLELAKEREQDSRKLEVFSRDFSYFARVRRTLIVEGGML